MEPSESTPETLAHVWESVADQLWTAAQVESDRATAAHLRGQAAGLRLAARQLREQLQEDR